MLSTLPAPGYVGYFTVGVPIDKADRNTGRAAEIVERYLYSPGEVVRTELSDDFETFLVLGSRDCTHTCVSGPRRACTVGVDAVVCT